LLIVSRRFMNVANIVFWRMTIILKANKVNLFVSSVLFIFWYNSPNFLDTPCIFVSKPQKIQWIPPLLNFFANPEMSWFVPPRGTRTTV
jgi:hypothetical protein